MMLDELDIAHGGVEDLGAGYIREFRDPDNIAMKLFAPKVRGKSRLSVMMTDLTRVARAHLGASGRQLH